MLIIQKKDEATLMSIDWNKIIAAPSKIYKIQGDVLLALKESLNALEDERIGLNEKIASFEEPIRNLQFENTEKDAQLHILQDKISRLNELIDALEKTVTNKDESMGNIMNMHANFMIEIARLNEEILKKKREIFEFENQNSKVEAEKNEFKNKTLELQQDLENLNSKVAGETTELNNQTFELQKTVSQLQDKITGLEDKLLQDQTELETLNRLNSELQDASEQKDNLLREEDEQINELNVKIETLDTQLEALKDQRPKTPVLEDHEGVLEGPACPHCGSPTNEIYKDLAGKKQLIRRYCTNLNCGFMEYIS